jgi:hypothetical protein
MTRPIPRDAIYKRRVFDAEIIELCVRWYISYRLSYRDLVEILRIVVGKAVHAGPDLSAAPRMAPQERMDHCACVKPEGSAGKLPRVTAIRRCTTTDRRAPAISRSLVVRGACGVRQAIHPRIEHEHARFHVLGSIA